MRNSRGTCHLEISMTTSLMNFTPSAVIVVNLKLYTYVNINMRMHKVVLLIIRGILVMIHFYF